MNICTKYGFDILIISGSYGGHRQGTSYNGRRMTYDEQHYGHGMSSLHVSYKLCLYGQKSSPNVFQLPITF